MDLASDLPRVLIGGQAPNLLVVTDALINVLLATYHRGQRICLVGLVYLLDDTICWQYLILPNAKRLSALFLYALT